MVNQSERVEIVRFSPKTVKNQKDTKRIVEEGGKLTFYKQIHPQTRKELPNWYCVIKSERGVPRFRISCQTNKYDDALAFARKEMFKRKALLETGFSPDIKSFKYVANAFLTKMRNEVIIGEQSAANIAYFERVITTKLLPFFGTRNIQSINSESIDKYIEYRLNILSPTKGTVVKNTTLNRESVPLRKILQFSKERGWNISPPKIRTFKENINNRPALSKEQWESFNGFLRDYGESLDYDDELTQYYRHTLRDYCQLILYSGLRCTEASHLKFEDIEFKVDKENKKYALINVRGQEIGAKKTGSRKVVGMGHYISSIYDRRKKNNYFNGKDDYFFQHPIIKKPEKLQGTRIKNFKKSFHNALTNWCIKEPDVGIMEIEGKPITPYTLRHTYAHLRLTLGQVDIYHLALNLGNSVAVCEAFYSHSKPVQFANELGKLINSETFQEG